MAFGYLNSFSGTFIFSKNLCNMTAYKSFERTSEGAGWSVMIINATVLFQFLFHKKSRPYQTHLNLNPFFLSLPPKVLETRWYIIKLANSHFSAFFHKSTFHNNSSCTTFPQCGNLPIHVYLFIHITADPFLGKWWRWKCPHSIHSTFYYNF